MTVREYILQVFSSFGIQLSEAELVDICNGKEDDNYLDLKKEVQIAVVKFIPNLLIRPNVSEGGVSLTYPQRESIKDYYYLKCSELGMVNRLKPKAKFL